MVIGELSLDGSVRHARGVLPMAATAREQGFTRLFVPESDAVEAALIPGLEVIPVTSLADLYQHLTGGAVIQPKSPITEQDLPLEVLTDFREVKGQEHVKRALEVAGACGLQPLMNSMAMTTLSTRLRISDIFFLLKLSKYLPARIGP
jgi:magnesium chelatase family protein